VYFTLGWDERPDGVQHNTLAKRLSRCKSDEANMEDPGYQFLSRHNVWGFGKLLHDMLTLHYPDKLDSLMKSTTEEKYYLQLDQHAIDPITTNKSPEYSLEIRELIRECLHIKIEKRPTPQELLRRTEAGLAAAINSRRDTGHKKGPRVYYMGHEINHMPLGNAGIEMDRREFRAIRNAYWPDPEWVPLLAGRWEPQVIGGDFRRRRIKIGGPKRIDPVLRGRVKADDDKMDLGNRGVTWVLQLQDNEEVDHYNDRYTTDDDSDDGHQNKATHPKTGDKGPQKYVPAGTHPATTIHLHTAGKGLGKSIATPGGIKPAVTRPSGLTDIDKDLMAAVDDIFAEGRKLKYDVRHQDPDRNRVQFDQDKARSQAGADQQQEQGQQQEQDQDQQRQNRQQQETLLEPKKAKLKLNPPKHLPPQTTAAQQQPQQPHQTQTQPQTWTQLPKTKKRRRGHIMGLSVDGNFQEADEENVRGGHNLRKRARRG
jgi:hypothetical protein